MWIPITIAAAAFQTARTALQHRLRALLSVSGAGFVRYLYGAPLALGGGRSSCWLGGAELPGAAWRFWPIIAAGGLAQILGTRLPDPRLRRTRLRRRHRASPRPRWCRSPCSRWSSSASRCARAGWIGVGGVPRRRRRGSPRGDGGITCASFREPAARPRPRSPAACFGLAVDRHPRRDAARSTAAPRSSSALVTLAVMNSMQTVIHGGYLVVRAPEQTCGSVFVHWRSSAVVGRAQRLRLGGLGVGARARERGQGAHARPGRAAVHVRRLDAGAARTAHAARGGGERARARRAWSG